MKQIVKTYEVYTYDELNEEAKERVKEWYLESQDPDLFTDIVMEDLKILFPHSELKIQYSLNSCQGDGFNIYGSVDLKDVLNYRKDYFTGKEKRTLKFYFCNYDCKIDLNENRRYSYCICDDADVAEPIIDELEKWSVRDINKKLIYKLENAVKHIFTELCNQYEKEGYSYFYDIDDETLSEICDDNEYYFMKNGSFFYEAD